jgi:phosphatidylcholine synthase
MTDESPGISPTGQRLWAYAVHIYTASGLVCAALIAADIFRRDYPGAFVWMILAVLIDATDGTLARKFRVKDVAPHIDGRKLDDIVDYLNWTFLPLLMIATAGWLPEPAWFWMSIPLIASVFAFVHTGAKEEVNGFFRGFPSYWNVFAFYTAVWLVDWGKGAVLASVLVLSGLSLLPVRFVYPNRAPRWRWLFIGGAIGWLGVIAAILWLYPKMSVPPSLLWLSAIYPVFYVAASLYLDRKLRASYVRPRNSINRSKKGL